MTTSSDLAEHLLDKRAAEIELRNNSKRRKAKKHLAKVVARRNIEIQYGMEPGSLESAEKEFYEMPAVTK